MLLASHLKGAEAFGNQHGGRSLAAIVGGLQSAIFADGGGGIINAHLLHGGHIAGVELKRAGLQTHADLHLLGSVSGIFFDGDERIGLNAVGAAVGERYFGNAFGHSLHDVAFIERQAVIGDHPSVAVCLLDAHGAVEHGETRLLQLAGGIVGRVPGAADLVPQTGDVTLGFVADGMALIRKKEI